MGIETSSQAIAERGFHQPVFAAMKADDRRSATGVQALGEHAQELFEIGELTIHEDAQDLKGPRLGMCIPAVVCGMEPPALLGLRLLPWDYGVRNLFRRPARSVLTLLALTLVVLLVFVVAGFVRGLDASLDVRIVRPPEPRAPCRDRLPDLLLLGLALEALLGLPFQIIGTPAPEVDPVSWTSDRLGLRSSRCRRSIHLMRRSSAGR